MAPLAVRSREGWIGAASAALVLLACNHDKVVRFQVALPSEINTVTVCANQTVAVTWAVEGKAELGTAPGGPDVHHDDKDFVMHSVPSQGASNFTVTQSTTYRIRAVKANKADDASSADQYAIVPRSPIDKGNTAACDASNRCKTSFVLDASPSMRVRSVASPLITRSGRSEPIRICVSHDKSAAICVDPNSMSDVGALAAGTWTLEAQLPAGAQPSPPPILKLHFDFGCP